MRKPDACPKCAHHDQLTLHYEAGPPERLRVECGTCGFTGYRSCADSGGDLVDKIQRAVARRYRISVKELLSRDRHKTLAEARQVACFLCRTLPEIAPSYPELGRRFGNRDHTTIMSAVKRGEQIVEATPTLRSAIFHAIPEQQLVLPGLRLSPGLVKADASDSDRSTRVA